MEGRNETTREAQPDLHPTAQAVALEAVHAAASTLDAQVSLLIGLVVLVVKSTACQHMGMTYPDLTTWSNLTH